MKKFRIKLLAILLIALPVTAYGASYTLVVATYPVNVNGQKIAVQPLNLNGTTYLPLRSISDAVGVPIEWNAAKKSVEINTVDIEELKAACVMIFAENSTTGAQGSAVCWDYNEYLTAYHVINNNKTSIKTSENETMTVDKTNQTLDIATLDTTDNVKPVKIGDSDELQMNDQIILISAPKGAEDTVTYGVVSTDYNGNWLIYATTYAGSSGGACFNVNGELIGIAIGANEKFYTMVPINNIRKAL